MCVFQFAEMEHLTSEKKTVEEALSGVQEENELQQRQLAKMKDELQKSSQRREKMLTEAVIAEREAWEVQVQELKAEHTKRTEVLEKMISKVAAPPAAGPELAPQNYETVATKLTEAETLITTQASSLLQKDREIAMLNGDASHRSPSTAVSDLRERLEKAEKLVSLQKEIIQKKDDQLKNAIDSAMEADGEGVARGSIAEGDQVVNTLSSQVDKLKAEKAMVLEQAKQAVDDLTSQLARTRSAREKELLRELNACKEANNNLKQQAAIDLQVKYAQCVQGVTDAQSR